MPLLRGVQGAYKSYQRDIRRYMPEVSHLLTGDLCRKTSGVEASVDHLDPIPADPVGDKDVPDRSGNREDAGYISFVYEMGEGVA